LIRWLVKLAGVKGSRPWALIGGVGGGVLAIIVSGNPLENPLNVVVGIAIGAFSGVIADRHVSKNP
jgi:hypothetical protein